MSEPKTKKELTRLAWLAALRSQGHRQCTGSFEKNGWQRVCALGLLIEIAVPMMDRNGSEWDDVTRVGSLAGLMPYQAHEVASRNDGDGGYEKHTFAEIADSVETMPIFDGA